ncbi:MAG: (2Fe-2S) ferredoxin domain-containing protein [Sphaerochaetaceae bacterium]|nr:(2Fe-2S) ferredoxin domain-containing protein [Sphaerochaetaceae bacterium]MDC7247785.1 (2Fe-2S) ferredoxin domain-containing protein [Sphaerochaetaceae bacterium]
MKIELCMGSSCFARGNALVLERLESLQSEEPGIDIELSGHLCMNECSAGPNVRIDGKLYQNLNADEVVDIILQKKARS